MTAAERWLARHGTTLIWILTAVAGCALVLEFGLLDRPQDAWAGLLVAALFGITLSLGGALFLGVTLATAARWSVPLRVVALNLARALIVPLIALGLCLGLGLTSLYPWSQAAVVDDSTLLQGKTAWLNVPLFLGRAALITLAWLGFVAAFKRRVLAVAADPTEQGERRLWRLAIGFLVVFGITISVAWCDWGMSLEPKWFSTMFGVYGFAGTFQGGIAAVTVAALLFNSRGQLGFRTTPELRHDLGRLLLAFSLFWAYIWYSQFMLIWYADLPEETPYFATRLSNGWSVPFLLNAVVNFGVPFFVLLPARAKRHPTILLQVALIVILGRWFDAYLLVVPASGAPASFPIYALTASAAVLLGIVAVFRSKARASRPLGPGSARGDLHQREGAPIEGAFEHHRGAAVLDQGR
jgi:hypothetical protein